MSKTAIITGGTSGIGASFARLLAARGYSLILTGRRMEPLRALARSIRQECGVSVETVSAELADPGDLESLARTVSGCSDLEILVNNAGFGYSADFGDAGFELQTRMLDVHVRAVLELVNAALSTMKLRNRGAIINVASVAGFFPMPRSAMYSATKAFLVSFSESLSMELPATIRVQALCPGMTRTDFHERMGIEGAEIARRKLLAWMNSDVVAKRSLRALRRGRVVYVPGWFNKLLVYVFSHLPRRLYYAALRRIR